MSSLPASLLWFVVVIAAIPLVLWLLKRTPLGAAGAGGLMRTVASLPISPSQRLVTVEVGTGEDKRWLVLGVTPQAISTVYMMVPQDEASLPPATLPTAPFAQLLRSFKKDGGGS
ncbi:MAG: FliO/MopB family protein [Betaproteobacteria bacterium]